ncbi:MAG: hypothetical protein V3R67_08845 [Thermodesulfobacteriota bacterium]
MNKIFNAMDNIIETFSISIDKLCKGKNCHAKNGIGHSHECKKEHSDHVNGIPIEQSPPLCFDRAEMAGRVFDNCRYINNCRDVKPICGNYPEQN